MSMPKGSTPKDSSMSMPSESTPKDSSGPGGYGGGKGGGSMNDTPWMDVLPILAISPS